MHKIEYLKNPDVRGFVEWATALVSGHKGLKQRWNSPKGKGFSFCCTTLLGAFERYEWPMNSSAKEFDWTANRFEEWRAGMADRGLWDASVEHSRMLFCEAALQVTKWGEMHHIKPELIEMQERPDALQRLFDDARLLDPMSADAEPEALKAEGLKYMGAGYSKVYAMMLDDFPIYDSRVACALTSLIRFYCEAKEMEDVPEILRLMVTPNKGKSNRDPSTRRYKFRKSGGRNVQNRMQRRAWYRAHYASSNVRAAWILRELVDRAGVSGGWPAGRELLAIQSALFMVGYQVLGPGAVQRS